MIGTRPSPGPATTVAVFAAVAALTAVIVQRDPSYALVGEERWARAAELASAGLLVAAAVGTWRTGGAIPVLLAATATTWLVAEWNVPDAGLAFTFGLVLYAAWPAVLAAAGWQALDDQRLARAQAVVVWVAFGSGVGILGVASTLVFDPADQGCTACPDNWLLVVSAPDVAHAIGRSGLAITVAWVATYALLATTSLVRASPAKRRWSGPVLVPSVLALLLWAADVGHGLDRGFVSNDPTDRRLRSAQALALVLVAAGLALSWLRARRTRAALARLVLEIGQAPKPGEVRAWLAASLGDPTVALLYHLEDEQWIDAEGWEASLSPPEHGEVTTIRVGGQDLFAVVHRSGLFDDPTLITEIITTARLALEHDRLHAARRARLEQLRASRARIVAEADLRRRELERDLHDGAQQRLVAVALAIRLARRRLPASRSELEERLAAAEAGVRDAVVALRDVAHGLFPTVLADEGLAAALEELSERLPRLVPGVMPAGRFPREVESAAYFATLESLRLTDDDVMVDAIAEDSRLTLLIRAGYQPDDALVQIVDRVGAIGGTVVVSNGQLRVEMPCAS